VTARQKSFPINVTPQELEHAQALQAVDTPLVDPHLWTMQGLVKVARTCRQHGLN
jgi:hypothetical protein